MATNQASRRPSPPDNERLGVNFGWLSLWSFALLGLMSIVLAVFWYGYVFYPFERLEEFPTEPLREQVPLSIMPALPESLTVFYDGLNDEQRELLDGFGAANVEANTVRVPLEMAIDMMLENDGFPVAEQASEEGTTE